MTRVPWRGLTFALVIPCAIVTGAHWAGWTDTDEPTRPAVTCQEDDATAIDARHRHPVLAALFVGLAALAGDRGVRESGVEHVDDTARYSLVVVPEGASR